MADRRTTPVPYIARCSTKGCRSASRAVLTVETTLNERTGRYDRRFGEIVDHRFVARPEYMMLPETYCVEHRRQMFHRPVRGRHSDVTKCDVRCTSARGVSCDCQCSGANHGADFGG